MSGAIRVPAESDHQMSAETMIITPTYNERENLAAFVAGVREVLPQARILVVDDNSPDGTGDLADAIAAADEQVEVLHRMAKLGLGSAYLDGFRRGLERDDVRIFVQMDTDLSHDPSYLPALLAAHDAGADVVIGSRRVSGGGIRGWSAARRLLSQGGNLYARSILGVAIQDLTSGFRALGRNVVETIDRSNIRSEGYSFQIEVAYWCLEAGYDVEEVPIIFTDRHAGRSKIGVSVLLEAIYLVPLLRLSRLRERKNSRARE